MKADWDKLADEFHTSEKVLIADVDCTGAGEPLCERFDVQGFPTLKSFAAPETDGEDYDGGREFEDLLAFAKELKPGCGLETKENCSPEDLAELEAAIALGEDKIKAEHTELTDQIKAARAAHDKLVEGLQAQYEESNGRVEALTAELTPRMKLLRNALPPGSLPKGVPRDEEEGEGEAPSGDDGGDSDSESTKDEV